MSPLFPVCVLCFLMVGGGAAQAASAPSEAEPHTEAAQRLVIESLSFLDTRDFAYASKGFIAPPDDPRIRAEDGSVVSIWRNTAFLKRRRRPTVNPSLWRQARLNMHAGLFKVTDGIFQIRGMDVSNMTIIKGDTGTIINPFISKECAAADLALYRKHVPGPGGKQRPVRGSSIPIRTPIITAGSKG